MPQTETVQKTGGTTLYIRDGSQPPSGPTEVTPTKGGASPTQSSDSFSYSELFIADENSPYRAPLCGQNFALGILPPAAVAAKYEKEMKLVAETWRALRLGEAIPQGARVTSFARYASRIPGFARLASGFSKFSQFSSYLTKVPVLGRILSLGGGRAIPIVGAALSVFDVGADWYSYATLEKKQDESDEAFKDREHKALVNASINTGCTTAGAVIGGIIGSIVPGAGTVVGAMIGAGIGNIVGNIAKAVYNNDNLRANIKSFLKGASNVFLGRKVFS